jgi:hypothetical protein
MAGLIVARGTPDIVNLQGSKTCCFCGGIVPKRKQMWKFPDGGYMCIPCKTRFDGDKAKEVYSSDPAADMARELPPDGKS